MWKHFLGLGGRQACRAGAVLCARAEGQIPSDTGAQVFVSKHLYSGCICHRQAQVRGPSCPCKVDSGSRSSLRVMVGRTAGLGMFTLGKKISLFSLPCLYPFISPFPSSLFFFPPPPPPAYVPEGVSWRHSSHAVVESWNWTREWALHGGDF